MISCVCDESLGKLMQGDCDASLESNIQERVLRHVVVMRCFLLIHFVFGAGVGEACAVQAVVVGVHGAAATRDGSHLGSLRFNVLPAFGTDGGRTSLSADGSNVA